MERIYGIVHHTYCRHDDLLGGRYGQGLMVVGGVLLELLVGISRSTCDQSIIWFDPCELALLLLFLLSHRMLAFGSYYFQRLTSSSSSLIYLSENGDVLKYGSKTYGK